MPGVLALQTDAFKNYDTAHAEMKTLDEQVKNHLPALQKIPLIIIADDANFVSETLQNFLWVAFTRSNPSHDIYGIDSFTKNKHWGCNGPLLMDASIKPHHAPILVKDVLVEKSVDHLFEKGGSLYGVG